VSTAAAPPIASPRRSPGGTKVQSIRSALPLCDEFIVNVGRCDDRMADTLFGEIVGQNAVKPNGGLLVPPRRRRRHEQLAVDNLVSIAVVG